MSKLPLIALSLLMLSACSTRHAAGPTPQLPASLAARCPEIPPLPAPLIDPARLQWELDALALYAECAGRHDRTVRAWPAG